MKLSILQENFNRALSMVGRAISGKSTLPILANVKIEARDGFVELEATNLEITIKAQAAAMVDSQGSITVPHGRLSEWLGVMPSERIDLALDEETLSLRAKCGKSSSSFKGISSDEFPRSSWEGEQVLSLDGLTLKDMAKKVLVSVSDEIARHTLQGVNIVTIGEELYQVSADGHRLTEVSVGRGEAPDLSCIVPGHSLAVVAGLVGEMDQVTIRQQDHRIVFEFGDVQVGANLIAGQFPDFKQIVPTKWDNRVVVDRAEFLQQLKAAWIFARDSAGVVKLVVGAEAIGIEAVSAELGQHVGAVGCTLQGDGLTIAFNGKYLAEAMAVLDTPQVALEMTTATGPGILRPVGKNGYTHVMMPMQVRD